MLTLCGKFSKKKSLRIFIVFFVPSVGKFYPIEIVRCMSRCKHFLTGVGVLLGKRIPKYGKILTGGLEIG